MAAKAPPNQAAEYEGSNETLLSVVLGEIQKSGKAMLLSRVLVVARLSRREYTADNVSVFFNKVLEKHQAESDVTGFSLVYPFCACIMIEATMSVISSVLKDIVESDQNDSRIQDTKIVASTEDVKVRWFRSWHTAYVQSNASSEGAPPSDSNMAVKVASDVNLALHRLGKALGSLPDAEIRKQMHALNNFFDELPNAESLLTLLSAEDAPTVAEYLELFHSHINTDLDGEKVWPVPPPLCI